MVGHAPVSTLQMIKMGKWGWVGRYEFQIPGVKGIQKGAAVERVRVRFVGRVQGVGFRATTCSIATRFPVVGQVRNMRDGTVELVAEGASAELVAFVAAIKEQLARNIVEARENWSPIDEHHFEVFSVAPSEPF